MATPPGTSAIRERRDSINSEIRARPSLVKGTYGAGCSGHASVLGRPSRELLGAIGANVGQVGDRVVMEAQEKVNAPPELHNLRLELSLATIIEGDGVLEVLSSKKIRGTSKIIMHDLLGEQRRSYTEKRR